jgi:hypothetical protein
MMPLRHPPKSRGIVVVGKNNEEPVGDVGLRSCWSLVEAGNEIDKALFTHADGPRFYRFLSAEGKEVKDSEELNTTVQFCLLTKKVLTKKDSWDGYLRIRVVKIVKADTFSARPGNEMVDLLLGDKVNELDSLVRALNGVETLSPHPDDAGCDAGCDATGDGGGEASGDAGCDAAGD